MATRQKVSDNTAKAWDSLWSDYDQRQYEHQLIIEENSVRWHAIKREINGKFGSFNNLNILEIGAGSGHYSMLFVRQGAMVTVLDYSETALSFCESVFKRNAISDKKVKFVLMDAFKMGNEYFNNYDVSMSYGVAEHFKGDQRSAFIKTHFDVLKKGGICFISVPHANCIPFRVYQHLANSLKKRNIVECYPYSKKEFRCIAGHIGIHSCTFIGSSYRETYNPLSFYRRKRNVKLVTRDRPESPSFLDKYLGREITFVGVNARS